MGRNMVRTNKKITVGDLVCYNACGMKNKTIGLVLELRGHAKNKSVLVQWSAVGEYMPRKTTPVFWGTPPSVQGWHKKITPGDIVWHEFGDWFYLIK